ncbi:ABC transporter permease [Pseudothauera nasutitermitis]|uniref:ABC transporter permease n=1 Tax=Pseudothauera nasutitermitis TaxID=2565930 RepID=A0A4S4B3N0_9RHOO|nr:ABC transporter permease [Pseudothauera nasutitermitis]THF65504.1 ABC transporter permease [Pseudothauera nasutitermitis]
MLFKLALRNIFRQKLRTAMTLGAIVFGVGGLILSGGFVHDIFHQLGEAIIHSQTGHVQVFRKDFMERGTRQPERYLIDQPEQLAARIQALPEVDEVAARLNFAGLINNGRRDLAIIGEGVEPDKEGRLGTYLRITAGRQLTDADRFGILLGQGVAHSLGLAPGDAATLVMNTADGALNTLDFEVVGVFQSFSKDFDARAVRIPLAAARELMFTPGANLLVVTLQRTEDTAAAHAAIGALLDPAQLEARDWRQLSDFYDKTVQLYDRQFGVLQWIILFMVLLSVANTVNMSAFERLGEFGTLQALGNRRRDVFRLIVAENLLLGLLGAALGVVTGITLALAISAVGIPMPPPPNANVGYTAFIRVVPATVLLAFLIGFAATVLAALFPARRVSATPVVEALRQSN